MAGVPLASFFANVYLGELDRIFEKKGIPYLRYSDDIIIFCHSFHYLRIAAAGKLNHLLRTPPGPLHSGPSLP